MQAVELLALGAKITGTEMAGTTGEYDRTKTRAAVEG